MRVAAVVCTYGRAALAQLLACVERQTVPMPTLVWVDDAAHVRVLPPDGVEVMHGPRMSTIGAVRHAAVEAASSVFDLGPLDGFMTLDDDDFYSSQHFEQTAAALERAGSSGWTGALSMGLSYNGSGTIEHVSHDSGIGQHATWAFRFDAYDAAGGYPDDPKEDLGLAYGVGFEKCRPHWHTTHVRRQNEISLSGLASFDPMKLRSIDTTTVGSIYPRWSDECERFERWCSTRPLRRAG